MHAYLQPMEVLIQQIDPEGSGCITFAMFRAGVETYLASELCSRDWGEGREWGRGREWESMKGRGRESRKEEESGEKEHTPIHMP